MAMMDLDSSERSETHEWIAAILFVGTVFAPALEMGGFGLDLGLGLPLALAISSSGACAAGALADSRSRLAGAIGGLLAGAGVLTLVWLYVSHRDGFRGGELVLPALVGAAPGILAWYAVRRLR